MTKLKFGYITLLLGVSLLGLNISLGDPSLIGLIGSMLLIVLGIWDFVDHYAEVKAIADAAKTEDRVPNYLSGRGKKD